MNKKEFLGQLEEMLEMDEGSLKGEDLLDSLEIWDSLAVVSFIALVDQSLQMVISPEKFSDAQSVDDLCDLIGDKLSA